MGDLIPLEQSGPSELALISQVRQMLAEAKTLPDFRKVMEMAAAATDVAKRAARLREAQGMAIEVVQQANEVAAEAAAVRLAAQAGAGETTKEMKAQGRLLDRPGPRPGPRQKVSGSDPEIMVAADLFGGDQNAAEHHIQTWEKIASIPETVRAEYIEQVKKKGDDVPTTAGLLRYAAVPKEEPKERSNLEVAYDDVMRALTTFTRYDPGIMFGHASSTRRRTKFREVLDRAETWIERAKRGYGDDD